MSRLGILGDTSLSIMGRIPLFTNGKGNFDVKKLGKQDQATLQQVTKIPDGSEDIFHWNGVQPNPSATQDDGR